MKTKSTLISFLAIFSIALSVAFTPNNSKRIIVIDAAHGGKDLGATAGEVSEKQLVQAIASKIKSLNKNENIELIFTRSGDNFIELKERINTINSLNADLVISLHVNKANEIEKSGPSIFISKKNPYYTKSMDMAKNILQGLSAKEEILYSNFNILNNTNCAAISVEVGYISNEKDRNYLLSEAGQTEIATKILNAIN
jgi:N-acetylmuramoyl-L-alanine amidase